MEDYGMRTERKGTGKSAIGLVIIVVLAIALVGLVAWVLTQPGVLDSLVNLIVILAVAIVIIAVIAFIAVGIIGIGMYATKGEVVQTGVSHSLDDVEAVEGSTLDKKDE